MTHITRRTALSQIGAAAALVSVQEHATASELSAAREALPGKELHMNMVADQSNFQTVAVRALKKEGSEPRNPVQYAMDLSFMRLRKPRGTGIDYWVVSSAGDYGADCEKGHKLADEFLTYIGRHPTHGLATILPCIVNGMLKRCRNEGRLSGVEVAFLSTVNQYAISIAKVVVAIEDELKNGNLHS